MSLSVNQGIGGIFEEALDFFGEKSFWKKLEEFFLDAADVVEEGDLLLSGDVLLSVEDDAS